MRFAPLFVALALTVCAACNKGNTDVQPEPKPAAAATGGAAAADGALHLGAPIAANVASVALSDVAKNPSAYVGKELVTTGTVTSVCQAMGCWMEIKDDSGEAHIKMAGHKFFVPKTASGRKARVLAKIEPNAAEGACSDEEEGMTANGASTAKPAGCKAEAEAQLGHPLAKLELVADGVELL